MDRPLQGALRNSWHARAVDDRAHYFAWLHPAHELGRLGTGGHGETGDAGDLEGVTLCEREWRGLSRLVSRWALCAWVWPCWGRGRGGLWLDSQSTRPNF